MRVLLRTVAAVLLVAGVIVCAICTRAVLGDETYRRAALALERHPDHILYQAEYHAALVRHVAYVVAAVMSGLAAVVGSLTLFGLAAVLRRLDRLQRDLGH